MQFRLHPGKHARHSLAFALASLILSACSTQPSKPSASLFASPAPATGLAARSEPDGLSNAPVGYYDTDGSSFTQDDIDELLGVTEMEPVALSPEELAKFGNLWERVRAGFRMDLAQNNPRIELQRNWFAKRQDYIDRMTARASHYLYFTVTEAEKRGLPTELALLPVIESSYDPFAYSPAQAAGMWQFIPGTGKIYGLKQNYWYDGRRDVMQSTRAAYEFLSALHKKFGSWELALAAYNCGPGCIDRAINKNAASGLPTDFWSLDLPEETRAYVPRFLAVAQIINAPSAYNLTLRPIVNQAHFRTARARSQVELESVARIAGLTLKQLYQLNPGFLRWATDPVESRDILVPVNAPGDFDNRLASLPPAERTVVQRYRTKKGDTLGKIADRFDTSSGTLKKLNKRIAVKKKKLVPGQWLVVAHTKVKGRYYDGADSAAAARVAQLMEEADDQAVTDLDEAAPETRTASAEPSRVAEKSDKPASQDAQDEDAPRKPALKGNKGKAEDKVAATDKDKPSAKSRHKDNEEVHKVRPGETLFAISRKYGISPKELARWNDMKLSDSLRPGKRLVIRLDDDEEDSKASRTVARKDKEDNRKDSRDKVADSKSAKKDKKSRLARRDRDDDVKQIRYEVRRGDTLYSISKRYKVTVSQLQTWNKGSRTLKPGQDIVLYLAKS